MMFQAVARKKRKKPIIMKFLKEKKKNTNKQ